MAFTHCRVQPPVRVASVVVTASVNAVDCRRVLGVSSKASKCEIKAAFRKLALRSHPDVCDGEECSVDFVEVKKAYESLMASDHDDRSHAADCSSECDQVSSQCDQISLREDYSNYYSNLKYYSNASRNRRYTGNSYW